MSEMPNLELRITDNAEQTARSLGSLASSLTRIQKAIDRGLNLDQAGHAVNRLGKIIENSFSTSAEQSIQSLRRLANAIVRIQKTVNTGMRLNEAGTEIREFGSTIGTAFGDSSVQAVKSLGTLANSLSKVQKLINSGLNLSKAGEEIKKFGLTIENAFGGIAKGSGSQAITGYAPYDQYISSLNGNKQVNVESYEKAVNMLSSFAKSLNRVQKVIGDGLKLGEVGSKIEQFGQSVGRSITDDVVARYERFAEAVSKIKGIKLPTISNPLAGTDLETALNKRVQFALGNGTETANLIKQFTREVDSGLAKGTLDDSQVQIYQNAIDGLVQTERALNSAQRHTNQETQDAAPAAQEAAESTKTFRDRLKELFTTMSTGKHHSNGLLSAFIRIAKYRFLRTVIKEITDGFSMGLSNMYEYAKVIGHTFAPAVDSAQNALFKMKNSLGAALAPVLQMIIPYVVQLVHWFIDLINVVNQFFALLRGQTTWTRATDAAASSMDRVRAATSGVGHAAREAQKEVKGLLADWDELNIIQQDTGDNGGSGSGSGGGASGYLPIDYASMFEEVDVFDEKIKKIISWLKDHMNIILSLAKLIGAAWIGWKLNTTFTSGLGKIILQVLGIAVALYGAYKAYGDLKDQWENGIDWGNFTELVNHASLAVGGLTAAFGLKGLGAGLAGFGLAGIVTSLKDIVTNGEASKEALEQLKLSLLAEGVGASILTGNWVFAIAGALGAVAIEIYQNKEKIVGYIQEHISEISNLLKTAGEASIAVGAMLAFSGVSIAGGIGLIAAGLGLASVGDRLPDAISSDVEQTFKNIAGIVGEATLAVGAILAITGVSTIPGLMMMVSGLALDTYAKGEGTNLETYVRTAWQKIKGFVLPASLGFFALGAVLALTGAGIVPGLKMMAMGVAGISSGAVFGDLLSDLEEEWNKIRDWANPLSEASFALGLILALTGVGVGPGIAMMAAGISGFAADLAWGTLLDDLKQTWENIVTWAKSSAADFLELLETPINFVIDAINSVIEAVNNIPGVDIGKVNRFDVNKLRREWGLISDELAEVKENASHDEFERGNILVDPIGHNSSSYSFGIDRIKESAESATEALEGANEQLEKLKNSTVPVEAAVTAAENSEETVTFEVPEQEPVVIDVPVSYNIVSDETSADAGAVEYEYDTGDVEALKEKIREALSDFNINTDSLLEDQENSANYFWSQTLESLVDSLVRGSGFEGSEAERLKKVFYDKFWDSLFDETFEGGYDAPLLKLQDAIDNISELEIPTINDTGMVDGLSGTATNVESIVDRIRGAIKSLDGLSFNFSGGLMGGGFKVVMPAMAAEGGMFTTGQMFIARERGPEIVGTMNGKSAVANNNQIVSGISAGVATANQEEVRTLNRIEALLNRIEKKEFAAKVVPSSGFGKDVRRSLDMYARNTGVSG